MGPLAEDLAVNLLAMAGTLGRLALARATGGRRPFALYFIVTERCPNTCGYCGYRDSVGNRDLMSSEMTLEAIRPILAEAGAMGCRKVHLTGGEPLARSDIGAIADAARDAGMFVGISTSGVGLPARIDALGAVELAFVSLDGPAEVHNAGRGKADFAAAVSAVEAFLARGKRVFTTTVLGRRNVGQIPFLLEFARAHGILANFVFLNSHAAPDEKSHLPKTVALSSDLLSPEEMRQAIGTLLGLKRGGAPIGSTAPYFEYLESWPDYAVPYREGTHAGLDCSAGRFYAYLFPDGRLYPCGDLYWRMEPRDAKALGFRRAFETLPPIPCRSCRTGCYIEQNLVFGMDPRAGMNWLSLKIKGQW